MSGGRPSFLGRLRASMWVLALLTALLVGYVAYKAGGGELSPGMAGSALAVCVGAVFLFSRYLIRSIHQPVAALSESADSISRGDFSARVRAEMPAEFEILGGVLNELAGRVSDMVGELASDRARLGATLRHISEGVALLGPDGEIAELNPAMIRLYGLEGRPFQGRSLTSLIAHREIEELVKAALREGDSRTLDVVVPGREDKAYEAQVNPVRNDGRIDGCVLVLHDVTRRRRLEEMRREFVANVSHELRTPLASIKGYAETLRRGGIEDEENRLDFVRTIESHADRLTRLVDELLELAAIESGKEPLNFESVGLAALAGDVMKNLRPIAEAKNVSLECGIGDALMVSADAAALRRVFQNLLINAIKYNKEGGAVVVTARADGEKVRVFVRDTGIGIPAKDLPHVFERFYRVDRARSRELGGTGLGLAIVRHILENHGGGVWAESVLGEGSVFHFTLPYSPKD